MLEWVREGAKSLPHPLLMRLYAQVHRWREQRLGEQARRRAGVPSLGEFDLGRIKGSDTLFVLGSGASINHIPAERWKVVARHDTVGFNFWLFHPFVPKIYFFESLARDNPAYKTLLDALAERADGYAETLKVIMDMEPPRESLFELPAGIRRNLYAAKTISMLARNERELAAAVAYLVRSGAFRQTPRFDSLLKYNGSVSSVISLGIRMGYRRIVLCGIDMTRAEYFYQDAALYPERQDIPWLPQDRDAKHHTYTSNPWMVPMDLVIAELTRTVLEPAKIELYVESRSSALWPKVPEAPESLWTEQQSS
ncbi:MAG: hypothetical protein LAN37_10260 [Acidobacteriia bacterium]|nr:hypothetical protein [Terriglobia bacterium]